MCTAISSFPYFGRTLDLSYHYNETIAITKRKFPLKFKFLPENKTHFAFIGTATVAEKTPLYYDGLNEAGICIAALNFPKNARYFPQKRDKLNVASFEFIPFVLSAFKSVDEVREVLKNVNITDTAFSDELPVAPLHWIISDGSSHITVEQTANGLEVHNNKVGVLSNNPPFLWHIENLNNYCGLGTEYRKTDFSTLADLEPISFGFGAFGLAGDNTSPSRFVRAAFNLSTAKIDKVTDFFRILDSVSVIKGTEKTGSNLDYSVYTACYDLKEMKYYYKTYQGTKIMVADMKKENLTGDKVLYFPLETNQDFTKVN